MQEFDEPSIHNTGKKKVHDRAFAEEVDPTSAAEVGKEVNLPSNDFDTTNANMISEDTHYFKEDNNMARSSEQ